VSTTRTAIITGASKGIGAALARRCVAAGMRVAMLARTPEPLQVLVNELGTLAAGYPCDVTDAGAVSQTAARIMDDFGAAPDLLVNNAGLFQMAPLESATPIEFTAALQTNLVAPFLFTRAVLPAMRARGSGIIVSIGSIADRQVFPANGAYAASKYGLRAMHEVLRAELRGTGVRTTLVSPGPVDTALWDPVDPDSREGFTPRASMLTAGDVAEAIWYAVSQPDRVNIDELRLSRS
jgi:NADP-dependent 3-hydroxy acid dehydrogenase YdfG